MEKNNEQYVGNINYI